MAFRNLSRMSGLMRTFTQIASMMTSSSVGGTSVVRATLHTTAARARATGFSGNRRAERLYWTPDERARRGSTVLTWSFTLRCRDELQRLVPVHQRLLGAVQPPRGDLPLP